MDEIVFLSAFHESARVVRVYFVPADMRDLVARSGGETAHAPRKDAETIDAAVFFGVLEKYLHSEADAEKRPAAGRRLAELLTPMAVPCDAWSTFARCGVRVLVASRPCARTRGDDSTIPRPQNGLWRFRLVQKAYWLRYRLAFRLDLLLRRISGR